MTTNFFFLNLLVFFPIFLIFSCNSDSTKVGEKTLEELQKANLEAKIGIYQKPKSIKYSSNDDNFLSDKFYPLGWSQDGYFAYITELADEAMGCSVFEFNILNTINNTNVWKFTAQIENNTDLDTVWKINSDLIKKKFSEFKIIQQDEIELGKTSFNHNNKDFKIVLTNETQTNKEYGFDVITATKISLSSQQLGTKLIYDYKEVGYSLILGQLVVGQILSPFEDRIVVVLKNERWGYEGPPNVIYFDLIGSNLTESFVP